MQEMGPHVVSISCKPTHNGLQIRAAFEDVRVAPKSSLLQQLDAMNYVFLGSSSIIEEDAFSGVDPVAPPEIPRGQLRCC